MTQRSSVLQPKQYIGGNPLALGLLDNPKNLIKEIQKGWYEKGCALSIFGQYSEIYYKDQKENHVVIKDSKTDYSISEFGPNDLSFSLRFQSLIMYCFEGCLSDNKKYLPALGILLEHAVNNPSEQN